MTDRTVCQREPGGMKYSVVLTVMYGLCWLTIHHGSLTVVMLVEGIGVVDGADEIVLIEGVVVDMLAESVALVE